MINRIRHFVYKLLRKSEKYTATDMVYLAKGGFWLTLGQVISSASAFLLAIVFANLLPKETYGQYKYILSIVGILSIPTLRGMNTALMRSVSRGLEGSITSAVKTKIRWGLIGSVASLALSGYYYFNDNIGLTIAFLIVTIFLPFMDTLGVYDSFLTGKKLFSLSTKYNNTKQVIVTLALVATLLLSKNIFLIIFVYFIANTVLNFIIFKIVLKKNPPNTKQDPEMVPYGKHISLINTSGDLIGHLDKIILWHFLGGPAVAIWAIAAAPVVQLRSFLKPITPLAIPKIANIDKEVLKKTIPGKIIKMLIITSIIVLAYVLLSPYLYKLFFPKYLESIKYTQIYALVLLFFPKKLMSLSIMLHAKKKLLYVAGILPPIVSALTLLILTPLFGIMGIIAAKLITEIFTVLMSRYIFKRI